jgi:hypothetical protein
MEIPVNWWAIIVTSIISVIIGSLWYGPLFGKMWMASVGISMPGSMTPEIKKAMYRSYALVIVGSLIMNYVLLHSIVYASSYYIEGGVAAGLMAGFWNWLGFVVPVSLGPVLWENRPWKFWFITAGYYLVLLLINGAILAVWL